MEEQRIVKIPKYKKAPLKSNRTFLFAFNLSRKISKRSLAAVKLN